MKRFSRLPQHIGIIPEEFYGERVPFSSVNEALSTHARGDGGRFRRVRCGTYEMAGG